jgi:hypothetical protein
MPRDLRTPRPREVEGFAASQAAGLAPARPTSPPNVGPGVTARGALRRLALVAAGSVGVAIATLLVLPKDDGALPPGTLVAFLIVLAVGLIATWRSLVGFREALLRELQAGYVTTTFEQGVFWFGPAGVLSRGVVGWDWSGIWVLEPTGEVVASPRGDTDPPGAYPSPHEPGRRELWTGYRWTMFYID